MINKFNFVDLFAGCGGLSDGFLQSGRFNGLAHIEWEKAPVQVLRHRLKSKWNHSDDDLLKNVIHFDVQKIKELLFGGWSEESINKYSQTNHPNTIQEGMLKQLNDSKIDVVIGGPPCQAYSIAGRAQDSNSMKDDYRNYLFESFVEIVDSLKPKMFVFENVPGMLSASPGGVPVTQRIYEAFDKIGYEILKSSELKNAVLDSSHYGVPQSRRRVIIVGIQKSWDNKPTLKEVYNLLKDKQIQKPKTVRDAIGNYEALLPLKVACKHNGKNQSHELPKNNLLNHTPRYHNERDIKVFNKWVSKEMNKEPMIEKIAFYNKLMNKDAKHAKYRNLEWDKPSPTIVAHLNKDGLMFIHPDSKQARSISVREAATLQSFPLDFEFPTSQGAAYKMIGNAVPVKMAQHIADTISVFLEGKK